MSESNHPEQPSRILIVDDEKTLRLVLRRTLEKQGYSILEAANGKDALQICAEQSVDMVLLDAMMPGMDGFTCCTKLHEMQLQDVPPVLMVTVLEDSKSVDLAFEVGATDYVTKPIHWPVLRQRVRRLLQQRWMMQEIHRKMETEQALIAQLEAANRELQRLATVDGLTEIANRRRFNDYLNWAWQHLAREGSFLSIVLCDVDFFKQYNDTYGHQAGDACLHQVAEVLTQVAKRSTDLVARYGGEEFALILLNTNLEGAIYLAEQVRDQVKKLAIPHAKSNIAPVVTLSCGVASVIPQPDFSEDLLLSVADDSLYEAKMQGRDRVVSNTRTLADILEEKQIRGTIEGDR
jgi:diguanylate cyclase (GGDEF)-like protein